jgi:catechol 2,3-dioxygenase-like lactoylglutathione lyase family enzyme
MKQSVSLITLGVSDYEKANAFYAALGWQPVLEIEETAFFQANGVVLVLWRGRSWRQTPVSPTTARAGAASRSRTMSLQPKRSTP